MEWFAWVSSPEAWIALLTLTVLEIVLGIDNVVIYLGSLQQAPGALARPRAQPRPKFGDGHAYHPALFTLVGYRLDRPALQRARAGDIGTRPHPYLGRAIPAL